MKATIKEMKEALSNNYSTFLGVVNKELSLDEIECRLKDFLNMTYGEKSINSTFRYPKKVQSNAIQFTGESWLYFDNKCKKQVEKIEYEDGILFVFKEKYDNGLAYTMVYYVYNK